MPSITSITITKNNAAHIAKCLNSLQFCDQRVIVDSGSTDDTVEIARQHGAEVVYHEWLGFGPQKNFGLTLAKGDWIFWLDADEEVTPELAVAVKQAILNDNVVGYHVSRLSWFCGQPMRHRGGACRQRGGCRQCGPRPRIVGTREIERGGQVATDRAPPGRDIGLVHPEPLFEEADH